MLEPDELVRYSRQIMLPEIGEEGQEKLKGSHAVIIGVGGLGCASATYLAAAGVGSLTIVDSDTVSLSDLNRQTLYREEDIGQEKVIVAQRRLSRLNPRLEITPVSARITGENILAVISGADVVIDGLDNLAARLLVNSACVKRKAPFIYGGVSRLRGMATTILPGETPCLACISPEGVSGVGVLGALPGVIGCIQALEAIKILCGQPPSLAGRLLLFGGDDMSFRSYEIKRNESCPVCSKLTPSP